MATAGTTAPSPHHTYAAAIKAPPALRRCGSSNRPPPFCFQCSKSDPRAVELNCARHSLCKTCLQKNVTRFGSENMYRCPAEECVVEQDVLPIWIFVDHSNAWIGAKKLGSKRKEFESEEDHRVRINYGLLTDAVANERPVAKGTLYGSEPPRIDPVWKKIRECGWEVKTLQKDPHSGKEKEVDNEIISDILKLTLKQRHSPSTIVLVSGDADMRPGIKTIMTEAEGWKLEVCIWDSICSHRLRGLTDTYPNVSITSLDEHWENVIYTEKEFPAIREIPEESTAILTIRPGTLPKDKPIDQDHDWWKQLEEVSRWPVQYKWKEGTNCLLLVFKNKKEDETRALLKKIQILPGVQRCELYADYKRRSELIRSKKSEMKDEEPGWTLERSKRIAQKVSKIDKSLPAPVKTRCCQVNCCSGKNCEDGLNCKFSHSEDDKRFFHRNRGQGNPRRKTRPCRDYPRCKPSIKCNFAHEEIDRWCTNCHNTGHFSKSCPNSKCTHPRHA